MNNPVIREARPEDLDVLVEFNARLAHESEAKLLDRSILRHGVAEALGDPERLRYWVAEVEAEQEAAGSTWVVGQAAVTREWSDWRAGWIWWFQSVYVHPDFRGRGIFRGLHARIREAAMASEAVIGLRLYVDAANEQAQRVYQSLGMKPSGYQVYEEIWIKEIT